MTQVDNSLQTFRYNIASRVKQFENNSFWTANLHKEISKLSDSTESKFVWNLKFYTEGHYVCYPELGQTNSIFILRFLKICFLVQLLTIIFVLSCRQYQGFCFNFE